MKSKNRLLASVICLLMVVFGVVGLTACDEDGKCSHQWGEWSTTTNANCTEAGTQERKCSKCGETETSAIEALGHDWNEATCSTPKTCKICSAKEGVALDHIPNADDGDCTTEITCSVCGEVTTAANASHTGGTATCEHKAECTVCGKEYGELAGHTPNADDGDCTTAITCSVCGEITTEANASHTGGSATCEHKAACEVCGKEYGELAEHIGEQIWIKHLDMHYLVYSCCYAQISTTEDHNMVGGICTICGFNPSITITSAEVTPEDTQVTLTISITDNPGIAGLMLSLQYNTDVFNLTEATNGEALDALIFTAPNDLDSGCVFIWDSIEVNDEDVKNGVFLRLTFDIVPDSLEGEYSMLLKVNAYDNELTPFTLLIQGGKITIKNN